MSLMLFMILISDGACCSILPLHIIWVDFSYVLPMAFMKMLISLRLTRIAVLRYDLWWLRRFISYSIFFSFIFIALVLAICHISDDMVHCILVSFTVFFHFLEFFIFLLSSLYIVILCGGVNSPVYSHDA